MSPVVDDMSSDMDDMSYNVMQAAFIEMKTVVVVNLDVNLNAKP